MTVEKKRHQPEREKYAYIYAKTREDKQRWQKMADDAGYSLSSFLQGLIEDGLAYRNNATKREDLNKNIEDLRAENYEMREALTNAKLRIKQLTEDARRVRDEFWLDKGFSGKRGFDPALLRILRENKSIQKLPHLDKLKIDIKDLDGIDALERQLEALESYGFIEKTNKGWKWL
jgi:hypothetical protein